MFSKIDFGNGFGFWNTMPTRARSSTASTFGSLTFSPSISIVPVTRAIGMVSFMRLRQRRNVDLPQPDGPMKAMTAFSGISTVTFFSACFSP